MPFSAQPLEKQCIIIPLHLIESRFTNLPTHISAVHRCFRFLSTSLNSPNIYKTSEDKEQF
jgi:hypothetical protein